MKKGSLPRLPGGGREPGINKYWMPVCTGMTDSGGSLRLAVRHPQPFCHPRMGLSGIQCRCQHPLRFGDNSQWQTHWIVRPAHFSGVAVQGLYIRHCNIRLISLESFLSAVGKR
jgi:hypothetical protein